MKFNILEINSALGEHKTPVNSILKLDDQKFERMISRTGVTNVFSVGGAQNFIDLALKSTETIVRDNHLLNKDVILILATQSNVDLIPADGNRLREQLGLGKNSYVLDLNMGCSSFVYALTTAIALLHSTDYEKAIIVTGDAYSKYSQKSNDSTRALFSDACTSVLIETGDKYEILGYDFGGQGSNSSSISVEKYQVNNHFELGDFVMDGKYVYQFVSSSIPTSINKILEKCGLSIQNVNYFLFHQGSRVILEELTQKLNLEPSKVLSNIEQLGNTASASLPILLGELTNKLVSKDKLILSGFGVGLSWGTILIEVN